MRCEIGSLRGVRAGHDYVGIVAVLQISAVVKVETENIVDDRPVLADVGLEVDKFP